jgi:hypothetical protein
LKQDSGWFSVLSRVVRELDARLDRRQLQDEDLYNMSHSAQATEQPDQQDDRQRDADQPQQKTATHFSSPYQRRVGKRTVRPWVPCCGHEFASLLGAITARLSSGSK